MKTPKTLHDKALEALKEAIRGVVKHHKRTRRPMAIWKDGKVTWVSAHRLSH